MPDADYSTLAGFIRNRLREGKAADFIIAKAPVFVVPASAWGDTLPAMLVAGPRGESLLINPGTVLNASSFVVGGFSLQRAAILARVFRCLIDTHKQPERVRKHNGSSARNAAT